jgi:hypothetical protein
VTTSSDDESFDGPGAKKCAGCGAPVAGEQRYCHGCRFMPSPRGAAVAVLIMLGFGVLLGSTTSQVAQSAGLASILLEVPTSPPAQPAAVATAAPEPAPEAEPAPLPLPAAASSVPAVPEPAPEPAPEPPATPVLPPEIPEEESLPPVKHVFLIVLGENGFEESFGKASTAPYLAQTLAGKGELISNYYAVTKGDLANQVALLSGQGPTLETAADCPAYTDIVPGTISSEGQVEGAGCVYPEATPTLPGQLTEKKLKWKAYVEDLVDGCAPEAARPNPFVYFRATIDDGECARNDVNLEQLEPDLKTESKTPALSYLIPNACHDGGELPCAEGQPASPLEAEAFLQRVVPAIEASPAYREGGLIAITSSQARQTGPAPDPSSCCIAPAYPNQPPEAPPAEPVTGPVKPTGGGGRVGLLLLSPFVTPGSVDESGYFNHFSLLRSIEELFELEPLGYAGEEALTGFDSTVYNYETSSSSASCRDCASRVPSPDQSSPSSSKNPWRAILDLKATR